MQKEKSRTAKALKAERSSRVESMTAASRKRNGDLYGAHLSNLMAEHYQEEAQALMVPEVNPIVKAGEVLPENPEGNRSWTIHNTLETPDAAAVDASYDRTSLLLKDSFDVAGLAIDASQSIKAENSVEKMLAHQMALTHKIAFETADKGMQLIQRVGTSGNIEHQRMASQEGTRLLNAASRMMTTFQQSMLTLQKLRTGGQQTVTVQHVNVSDGGQAVIGNVQAAGVLPLGGRGDL